MNQKTTAYRYFFLFPLFCMLLSCTQDSYEKGEGRYSQMRGDFAEMHINSDKKAFSITTDDGDEFPLKEQFASQWIDTPDTQDAGGDRFCWAGALCACQVAGRV